MTIAHKLVLMVAVGLTSLLFMTGLSWYIDHSLEAGQQEMMHTDGRQVELAMNALNRMGKAVQAYKDCLLRNDPRYIGQFREETAGIESNLKEYLTISDPDERGLVQQALQTHAIYCNSIGALAKARETNSDIAYIDSSLAAGVDKPMRKALEDLLAMSHRNLDEWQQKLHQEAQRGLLMQVVGASSASAFLLIFGTYLGRGIKKRIKSFSEVIDRVAENDLSVKVDIGTSDEIGVMGTRLQAMLENLRGTVYTLIEAANHLSISASQLQSASEHIAERAEEASVHANTMATASEEMAATSADIARNCNQVADGAGQASDSAREGAIVVEATIQGMSLIADKVLESARTVESLGERSDQIGEIVGTIEDIADQTNLLALNAAIEAARAGEQGRGFAVVADEVRALAERTTRATREIGEMIKSIQGETRVAVKAMEDGVQEVEKGTRGAAQSGDALQGILGKINDLAEDINQIATAAEEQTATTREITNSIHMVNDISQKTSGETVRTTMASKNLLLMAEELIDILGKFKIEEDVAMVLNKAKSAHLFFIGKIKAHLDGVSQVDPNSLPNHLTCSFGQWYRGRGFDDCGHLEMFRVIDAPHAEVHELGKQAVIAYDSGHREKATQLCNEMVERSETLLATLDKLEQNYRGTVTTPAPARNSDLLLTGLGSVRLQT